MRRWWLLLFAMFLWGCSGATSAIRYSAAQQERCVSLSIHRLGPQYRELARVLDPWLYHSRGRYYFPDDIWQRWERRFLD